MSYTARVTGPIGSTRKQLKDPDRLVAKLLTTAELDRSYRVETSTVIRANSFHAVALSGLIRQAIASEDPTQFGTEFETVSIALRWPGFIQAALAYVLPGRSAPEYVADINIYDEPITGLPKSDNN